MGGMCGTMFFVLLLRHMKPRVVWLCSWYPNELDRFTGDFIQRHAVAASELAEIDVVHVVPGGSVKKTMVSVVNASLRETIIYTGSTSKVARYWSMWKAYRRFFNGYETEHGKPDLLHVHVAFPAGLFGRIWKHKWQIPMVLTEHYGIYNTTVDDAFPTRSFLFQQATRRAVGAANLVLPVSEALAKGMMQYVGQFPYKVVPNVVDTELFYNQLLALPSPFQFIHVSNMAPVKNISGILKAFAEVVARRNDVELHLVGAQPAQYIEEARQLGLLNKTVYFHAECTYAEVAEKVRSAHCGVLFSDSEMLPCSLLEWLCTGMPVIATRVGGIPEAINSTNGILVEAGNERGLTEAMLTMMEQYANYNPHQIALEAVKQYSYSSVGKQISDVYTLLLSNKK